MINPFLFSVLIGSIVSVIAFIFLLWPPKKINHHYGYRTPQAMRDQESWNFAQRFSARLVFALVFCSTIICGVIYFAVYLHGGRIENRVIETICYALPAFAALLGILTTELALALKKKR